MANTTPVAEEGKSLSACVSGTPSGVISGQGRRGDPLKVRGRVCYQANRRSEALSRQRDARRDLNNHIRRVAVEALAQDAEAEVCALNQATPKIVSKAMENACLCAGALSVHAHCRPMLLPGHGGG